MEATLQGIHKFACSLNRANREELYKISQIMVNAQNNTLNPQPQPQESKKEEKKDE